MNRERAARDMRAWARALVRQVDEMLGDEPDPNSRDWKDGYLTAEAEMHDHTACAYVLAEAQDEIKRLRAQIEELKGT